MNPETPPELVTYLKSSTRTEAIFEHAVTVGLDWWNDRHSDLSGLPVRARGHTTGNQLLTRQELFTLGEQISDDDPGAAAVRMLWHTLAWGTGPSQRGNAKRITAITANLPRNRELLRESAVASRSDSSAAFQLLRAKNRNTINYLGPNFFTKFLYFAGRGSAQHPCVIVDARVRSRLYLATGKKDRRFAPRSQYGLSDYTAALECMRSWAEQATTIVGRPVAVDEVERWAFGR